MPNMDPNMARIYTAHAKINLSLLITGKILHSYHLLDSLVTHTQYGDTVSITPHEKKCFTMDIIGQFAHGLNPLNNSVLDGANMIHALYPDKPYAHITLTKNLPIASGIGGGSSDCACVVRGLLDTWNIKHLPTDLDAHLLALGADVPVCYHAQPCIMRGIGGDITPHAVAQMHIVLVNPKVSVSTAEIFSHYDASFSENPAYQNYTDTKKLVTFLQNTGNDLTIPALHACPIIKDVLDTLNDTSHLNDSVLYVGMSGSGGTCFALCNNQSDAQILADKALQKGYWAVATQTL